jgi:6-phosphogluconolactonase
VSTAVRIFPDPAALAAEAARAVAARSSARAAEAGTFALALAGGRTPVALYEELATTYRLSVPWARIQIYWSDERYVPPGDPASNSRMAKEALLDRVPVRTPNVHPMPTGLPDPDDAAAAYESILRDRFAPVGPLFDLALLGLGTDGHTASLFPGAPALAETGRWVVPAVAPVAPAQRLTLTLAALNLAREVFFLVAGADKARAVARALEEGASTESCPAAGVRTAAGVTTWWLDAAAAAHLRTSPGR